jgi:hypothetical protein
MAKKEEKAVEVKALDKTNQNWYQGEGKITFCNSINELIEGKGETLEIREKIVSTKTVLRDEKTTEQHNLIIFILHNGKLAIVRKGDELK